MFGSWRTWYPSHNRPWCETRQAMNPNGQDTNYQGYETFISEQLKQIRKEQSAHSSEFYMSKLLDNRRYIYNKIHYGWTISKLVLSELYCNTSKPFIVHFPQLRHQEIGMLRNLLGDFGGRVGIYRFLQSPTIPRRLPPLSLFVGSCSLFATSTMCVHACRPEGLQWVQAHGWSVKKASTPSFKHIKKERMLNANSNFHTLLSALPERESFKEVLFHTLLFIALK